jgi:hypothetical protein
VVRSLASATGTRRGGGRAGNRRRWPGLSRLQAQGLTRRARPTEQENENGLPCAFSWAV